MGPGDRREDEPAGEHHDDPDGDLADESVEPPEGRRNPLPDPLDRVWVHPTELPAHGTAPGRSRRRHHAGRRNRARRSTPWVAPVAAGAAGALLTVVVLAVTGAFDASKPSANSALALRESTSTAVPRTLEALARLSPSVVAVVATDAKGTRRGSAVCIRHGMQLLTSARVVGDAKTVKVTTADGTAEDARVAGRDHVTDLVLLEVPGGTDMPAATLADAVPPSGSSVWLVGAPPEGGTAPWTSRGMASSDDALVVADDGPTTRGLLETDADSTSRAAGGALVDASGKVAGIVLGRVNPRSATHTYAVSIPVAIGVARELDATGRAQHGTLGAQGVDTAFGPMIVGMKSDAPAARAGMHVSDLVRTVDGRSVRSIAELTAVVRSLPPGYVVPISLLRDNRPVDVRVQLGATTG